MVVRFSRFHISRVLSPSGISTHEPHKKKKPIHERSRTKPTNERKKKYFVEQLPPSNNHTQLFMCFDTFATHEPHERSNIIYEMYGVEMELADDGAVDTMFNGWNRNQHSWRLFFVVDSVGNQRKNNPVECTDKTPPPASNRRRRTISRLGATCKGGLQEDLCCQVQ